MSFIQVKDSPRGQTTKIGDIKKDLIGPLESLENVRYDQHVYRYPLDVGNSVLFPHTVHFQAYTPKGESLADMGTAASRSVGATQAASGLTSAVKWGANLLGAEETAGRLGGAVDQLDAAAQRTIPTLNVDKNRALTGRIGALRGSIAAEISDLMVMYVSNVVQEQHSNDYSSDSLTKALGLAGLGLEAGSSLIESIASGEYSTKKLTPMAIESIGRLVGSAGLGVDGEVLTKYGLQTLGFAMNPQMEVLYNQSKLREFVFDFRMTPRSKREAEEVTAIIQKFKYHASPEFLENQGRYLKPPSFFEISYKFNGKENRRLHKFSTCVLSSIDVDYISGLEQFATYDDGMPVQIAMILRFTEMEMMHKKLREQGY